MTAPMTPEQLAEAEQAIERAHTEVGAVCAEGAHRRWRMSIPANPDRDSDLIISTALKRGTALLAEVKRLQAEVEDLRKTNTLLKAEADHQTGLHRSAKEHVRLLHDGIDRRIRERNDARAEVKRLKVDRDRWHDTYQQHANAVDEFFGDLLALLPGAEDTGSDAYDQIPRGIETLRADRDRARDIAVALEQENAALTRHRNHLKERLTRVEKEAAGRKAHGDQLQAEKDTAHAHVRRLVAARDAAARAVRSPDLTDAEKLAEVRDALAILDGEREPTP